jgi:hypothetical protein
MPEIPDDNWYPVGEDDKAIKDAFGKILIEGPNSFVKGEPDSPSFILKTKGYYGSLNLR